MGDTEGVDYDELYAVLDSVPNLGYPLETALLLWRGWEDHGVLPRAGGILDQPRQWQRLIQTLNHRLSVIESAVKAGEHDAPGGMNTGADRDLM